VKESGLSEKVKQKTKFSEFLSPVLNMEASNHQHNNFILNIRASEKNSKASNF
jgi:hypothetical protein